ncbi:MAG: hypothetical protein KDB07_07115, partial [Planctomycetes bacterium]|nr:hypothetical protein [Planctomycetota bacterium]
MLSKRIRGFTARKLLREANSARVSIDEEFFYEEAVGLGEIADNNGKATRQVLRPDKALVDYVIAMESIVRTYQVASLLEPEFPDPLSQLVDYYERTGQFDKAVETFKELEKALEDQPRYQNAIRDTLSTHLIRWGASLVAKFRAAAGASTELAKKYRAEAVEKYTEAWEVVNRLLDAERLRRDIPPRNMLSNAGIVAQELAKITHPDERIWYERALSIYNEFPESFEVERLAVLKNLALFAGDPSAARTYLEEALQLAKKANIRDREEEIALLEERLKWADNRSAYSQAEALLGAKDYQGTLDLLDKNKLHYGRADYLRARCFEALDDMEKATDAYFRARGIPEAGLRAAELLIERRTTAALLDAALTARSVQKDFENQRVEALVEKKSVDDINAKLKRVEHVFDRLNEEALVLATRVREEEGLKASAKIEFLETAASIARVSVFHRLTLAELRAKLARGAMHVFDPNDPLTRKSAEGFAFAAWRDYLRVVEDGAPFAARTLIDAALFASEVLVRLHDAKEDQLDVLMQAEVFATKQQAIVEDQLKRISESKAREA